jgi:tetratricopeptide (TPR) repeat protein
MTYNAPARFLLYGRWSRHSFGTFSIERQPGVLMTRALRGFAALSLLIAAPLAAQGPISDRLINERGKPAPDCTLPGAGHFLTSGAATYFKSGLEKSDLGQKRNLFRQARDNSLNAITNSGQSGSPAAWYYYGRASLALGDIPAADSALHKAEQLAPACGVSIRLTRRDAVITLIGAAQTFQQAGNHDSAMVLLRAAGQTDPSRPNAWYGLANSFAAKGQADSARTKEFTDSARVYFGRAMDATADTGTSARNIRAAAAFQLGVIGYNSRDYQLAVKGFSGALTLKPDDADARRNLVTSLRQAGMADSAAKIEALMLQAGAGTAEGLTTAQLAEIGVARYNAEDFAGAVAVFTKILEVEPNNRDALYNTTQSYRRLNNADKQLEYGQKLRAVEPLSFEAQQLIAQAYQAKKDQANLLKAFEILTAQTVDVEVAFTPTATGATAVLKAKGREARDANDRVIRAAPIALVVEFLDKAGAVVATAETTIPALAKDATQELTVTGTGAGIIAWRYKRK